MTEKKAGQEGEDRPALRLFFATLLHDGPCSTARVRKRFASDREYYRAVYAMSSEGFIRATRKPHDRTTYWNLRG